MISTTPRSTESASRPDLEVWPEAPDSSPPPTRATGSRFDRRLGFLAIGLALVVFAGGAIYYVTSKVAVDLSIDGRSQPIETRADTVGDLLDDHGITVVAEDLVVPELDTKLVEGQVVEVRYARPLSVTVDGVVTEHKTTELSVGAALAAIGAPTESSAISAPLDQLLPRSGTAVEIITPKSVNLDIGGLTSTMTSTAKTVEELLRIENIILADSDTVTPSLTTTVTDAVAITVTRIRTENEVRIEAIAHETVEKEAADLTVGNRSTATPGVDGEKEVTYGVTYTNDEVTSEVEVSATVTREPVTAVILVGTKPVPAQAAATSTGAPGGAASGLNWTALADCESSGNPKAVNPAGYYGLYQFSLSTWASVGGSGNPINASPEEQTNRAQILYNRSGAGQWPTCGRRLFN